MIFAPLKTWRMSRRSRCVAKPDDNATPGLPWGLNFLSVGIYTLLILHGPQDSQNMELKQTPLYAEHIRLGAKCAEFGGWNMPIQYSGIISEHVWTRTQCSLFDICHMAEFRIENPLRNPGMEKLVTVGLSRMACGSCRYGFILDETGGVIDDIIVYKISDNQWMMVVNAATAEGDFEYLRKRIASDISLENLSNELGKLDLQGPLARDVLAALAGDKIKDLAYYAFGRFSVLGAECIISRTGYTGELGYEIYFPRERIVELWQRFLQDDRVKPAGLGARDTLRLEVGLPLYGQDVTRNTTPLEAGAEKYLDFRKDFIGKEALVKQKKSGIPRRFVFMTTDSRRSPRHGFEIHQDGRHVGEVTSGTYSPSLEQGIAAGYVTAAAAQPGTPLLLRHQNIILNATVVERPLYKKGTARS